MAAYIEKRYVLCSDSDIDSTVNGNSEESQYVENDQWDFEETIGDKISDGKLVMEPNHFEPYVSDSDKDGDDAGHMFTTDW